MRLPAFIRDVIDDPRQRGVLVAGSLSLLAAGLVPRALSPGLPTAQEAIRTQPELQNLFVLLAFAGAATVIGGGLASDLVRRRWLLLAGLASLGIASLVALVAVRDIVFYGANFVSIAAAGLVLAYAIGSVAVAYEGIPRATALGIAYAAYGLGTAASPALMTLFPRVIPSTDPAVPSSYSFDTWPAYLLTAIAAAAALWVARHRMPAIPGHIAAPRSLIVWVAVWTVAILAIVSGALGLFGPSTELIPLALLLLGAAVLGTVALRFRRTTDELGRLRLDQRGLGAALAVGVAVGFAQAVPLMFMPIVFQYPLGYGQLGIVAIAPFAIALLVAGPVAGELIRRVGPRGMMTLGTLAVGLANIGLALALAWISGWTRDSSVLRPGEAPTGLPDWNYLGFVLQLVLVGAGFVLATTVRTAIVFASTPRWLPASAAALNEASVGLGSRIGIVAATSVLTSAALTSARGLADRAEVAPPEAAALVEEFKGVLVALGTPRFQEAYQASLEHAQQVKRAAYAVAYMDGVVVVLVISGIVGIVGAVLAWLLMGRRDPIKAVFDMQDERERKGYTPS